MSEDVSTSDGEDGELSSADRRRIVRERYADIATGESDGCAPAESTSCCSGESGGSVESTEPDAGGDDLSRQIGYSDEELETVEPGANLGLGCGNPTALASLESGDTVVDLGSGAGFDCFLAAQEVGTEGRVIGVDMTPEMVEKARANADANDADNVEFRLGEIEHLPVADATVDVILSNCVVNLSPDKPSVFAEAFRVLRPGGRLAISDVVQTTQLPADVAMDPDSLAGCVAGAATIDDLESMLADAGFTDIAIEPKEDSQEFIREWDDERDLSEYIVSATIEGRKPRR